MILLGRGEPTLESVVDASNLALFCTPAINLFPKRADRIHVSDSAYEYHVVPDRTRPLDFEVYEVTERRRPRHRHRQRAAVPAVLLGVQHATRSISSPPISRRAASRGWCRRRRSAAGRARATSAPKCFCRWSIRRRRRSAATCGSSRSQTLCTNRDLVLQMPIGHRHERLVAGRRRAGDEHPRRSAARAVRTRRWPTAPWRGARSAICRSTICRSCRSTPRGRRRGAARSARAVRGERRRERQAADRGIRSVRVGRVVRRLPCAGSARVRPRPRDHRAGRRAGVRGRAARSCSARCSIAISRVTCRSTRSPKPCCGPRAAGKSTDGGSNGARDRRSSVLRGAGRGAVPLRLLPDAAPAGVPVRRRSRAGDRRCVRSTSRCGSDRIRTCRLRPRRWRRSSRRDGRPPRLQVRLFGLLGPNGPLPLHITEYARERLRHAGDPTLSRFLDIFHHRFLALFYRAWAQAQPHVNRDRPKDGSLHGVRRRVRRHGAGARSAIATRCRTWPSSFTSARSIRQVRNAEGLTHILQHFFRVPVRIEEFVGHWLLSERAASGRCLSAEGAALGSGAVLGGRVWDRQHKFRIRLGPLTLAQYESFLPGGAPLSKLVDWVRMYLCFELDWDVRLLLKHERGSAADARRRRSDWAGRPGSAAVAVRRRRRRSVPGRGSVRRSCRSSAPHE